MPVLERRQKGHARQRRALARRESPCNPATVRRVLDRVVSLAVLAVGGCTAEVPDPCAEPVVTGEYSLHVVGVYGGDNLGLSFDWEGGSEVTGHVDYPRNPPVRLCRGTLEPAEAERITAAVNSGRLFCQDDVASDRRCVAWLAEDVSIETTDGTRANRFCLHGPCPFARPPDFDGAIRAPIYRLYGTGACDGPEVEFVQQTDRCMWPGLPDF